jgi:membrane-associated protease RseP (regulator of RpoE activity)
MFLGMIMLHEAGHAVAMRHRGVEIKEMGLGLPMKRLKLTIHSRFMPFPLVISPLLLGAYVLPTPKGNATISELDYRDQAAIYGAGVVVNIWLFIVLMSGAFLLREPDGADHLVDKYVGCALSLTLAALIYLSRRKFALILPVLGVAMAGLLAVLIYLEPADSAGGVVSITRIAAGAASLEDVLTIAGAISLSLAMLNMMPILPLDGGRIASAYFLKRGWIRFNRAYGFLGAMLVVGLVVYSITGDILHLL